MKKLVLAMTLAALAVPVQAADLPVKAPPRLVQPIVTWTGCYVGGNLGGAWASKNWANPEGSDPGDRGTAHFAGIVGGGQVGCDYQFAQNWVVGVQGMWDGSSLDGGVLDTANTDFNLTTRVNWFATITGRVGFVVQPNWLLYAKGGAAWVRDHHLELLLGDPYAEGSVTRFGFVVGGGAEWRLERNWSVFVEYNYMDFGTHRDELFFTDGGGPHHWDINQHVQAILVGLNYRFGGW